MSETSAENNALQKAMVEISKDLEFFVFDAKNTNQGYNYASAAGIIRQINKLLVKHGVSLQVRSFLEHFTVGVSKSGGPQQHAVVRVSLTFCKDGETEVAEACGGGTDPGDKAVMKAETAAYKYALAHKFVMGWGAVDPESDEKTDTDAKAKSKPEPRAEPEKRPVAEVVEAIAEATTPTQMKVAREMVLALKGDKGYNDLVKMYQARVDELKKAK